MHVHNPWALIGAGVCRAGGRALPCSCVAVACAKLHRIAVCIASYRTASHRSRPHPTCRPAAGICHMPTHAPSPSSSRRRVACVASHVIELHGPTCNACIPFFCVLFPRVNRRLRRRRRRRRRRRARSCSIATANYMAPHAMHAPRLRVSPCQSSQEAQACKDLFNRYSIDTSVLQLSRYCSPPSPQDGTAAAAPQQQQQHSAAGESFPPHHHKQQQQLLASGHPALPVLGRPSSMARASFDLQQSAGPYAAEMMLTSPAASAAGAQQQQHQFMSAGPGGLGHNPHPHHQHEHQLLPLHHLLLRRRRRRRRRLQPHQTLGH